MRRTRGLWASIIFVAVLVLASLVGLVGGGLAPKLGLDLEGGVSVILSAPAGTPTDVMEQALTNIRDRVDAFGVGEPQIFLSGNTIDVQIPGSANGTIEARAKDQVCLVGRGRANYGCAPGAETAGRALDELTVTPQPSEVCLMDPDGTRLDCFGSQQEADTARATLAVQPKAAASPTPSATPSASPSASPSATPSTSPSGARDDAFCIADPTDAELSCYPTKKEADAALKGVTSEVTENTYCLLAAGPSAPSASDTPTPGAPTPTTSPSGGKAKATPSTTPTRTPSTTPSTTPTASGSPSVSATPAPTAFSELTGSTQSPPCGLASKRAAKVAKSTIEVTHVTQEFCVVSSAGQDLGCFIDREGAAAQQRRTGQDRLLSVIGKTARLEQRPVLSTISQGDPSFATTPITCGTPEEQASKDCTFDALAGQEVVFGDEAGTTKYRLGPVVVSGDQVTEATAVLQGGSQSQVVTQWVVDFQLDGAGSRAFADMTTRLAQLPPGDPTKRIAIVVDRTIISAPEVQGAITGGSGVISGGFAEQESKDLATQLNAGALPVDLTQQSVQTVSPTLGKESLRQGIVAGVAGLILLFLYLLFYYRLLGVVAWFGMSIWAILALALVSLAGSEFGYALTLAGVAGLVISLGVTADSYIVFFERLKDEVRSGKSPRSSVQPAFKRAYRTIVAADIVTGIAAVALYLTAVSSVRGFALTLGVATLLDLFVVYFFKRPTVFLIARNERLVNLPGFGLTSGVAGEAEPGDVAVRPLRGEA